MLPLRENLLRFTKKIKTMLQTMEEIKKLYPDEWLILGDPVMSEDDQRVLAATVMYHSADKRELAYMDKPLMKGCAGCAVIFNRVTPRKMPVLVGGRTIPGTFKPTGNLRQPLTSSF
jgi:hypothetical protein